MGNTPALRLLIMLALITAVGANRSGTATAAPLANTWDVTVTFSAAGLAVPAQALAGRVAITIDNASVGAVMGLRLGQLKEGKTLDDVKATLPQGPTATLSLMIQRAGSEGLYRLAGRCASWSPLPPAGTW